MTLSNQQQADLAKVLQLRNNHVETGFMRPLQFLRKYAAPLSYSKSAVLMAPPELSISCGINDTGLGAVYSETPYDSGALLTWLDANDLALGAGSAWAAKAGSNGTLVASPTVSDGWTGGRRMVTLDGTSQYLTIDGIASAISGEDKPFSIALVYQFTANTAN